jgi:hypothetical protein
MQPISGLRPILKFQCEVVKARQVPVGPTAAMALQHLRRSRSPAKFRNVETAQSERELKPANIAARRVRILETHFPVTIERFRLFGLSPAVQPTIDQGLMADWQVEQAICNLVLSRQLTNGAIHYQDPSLANELDRKIARALISRFEDLDGDHKALHAVTLEQIVAQVRLDASALLQRFDGTVPSADLPKLQKMLEKRGLLHD